MESETSWSDFGSYELGEPENKPFTPQETHICQPFIQRLNWLGKLTDTVQPAGRKRVIWPGSALCQQGPFICPCQCWILWPEERDPRKVVREKLSLDDFYIWKVDRFCHLDPEERRQLLFRLKNSRSASRQNPVASYTRRLSDFIWSDPPRYFQACSNNMVDLLNDDDDFMEEAEPPTLDVAPSNGKTSKGSVQVDLNADDDDEDQEDEDEEGEDIGLNLSDFEEEGEEEEAPPPPPPPKPVKKAPSKAAKSSAAKSQAKKPAAKTEPIPDQGKPVPPSKRKRETADDGTAAADKKPAKSQKAKAKTDVTDGKAVEGSEGSGSGAEDTPAVATKTSSQAQRRQAITKITRDAHMQKAAKIGRNGMKVSEPFTGMPAEELGQSFRDFLQWNVYLGGLSAEAKQALGIPGVLKNAKTISPKDLGADSSFRSFLQVSYHLLPDVLGIPHHSNLAQPEEDAPIDY